MSQVLRQSTEIKVRIGPAVAVGDGFTPVTSLTVSGADEAEALKADGAATVDISGATWAAITGADGWYDLTLTTSHTDTVGTLDIVVNDDSLILPIFARFQVVEEAAFDAFYAASAAPATAAGVSAVETDTQDIQSRLPATLVAGRMVADVYAISGDAPAADNAESFFDGTGYAGTGNTIPTVTTLTGHTPQTGDSYARLGAPSGLSVSADILAVKGDTAAVLVDTADMQPKLGTPAVSVSADIAAVKVDTAAVLVDTADMQPKLGTPAVTVSADIAAVKVDTAAVLVDTADMQPKLGTPAVSVSADIAALQTDTDDIQARLPAALVDGKMDSSSDRVLVRTTILAYTAGNDFTLSAGSSDNNAYNGALCIIQDQVTAAQKAQGVVNIYTGATRRVQLVVDPGVFTFANGDIVTILADRSLKAATPTRRLVVDANGRADISLIEGVDATDQIDARITAAGLATAASISALNNLSAAQVNAEVVDVLTVDTQTLPGQTAPTATPTFAEAIMFLYKAWRNRTTQTAAEYKLYADDATTVDQKATVSDDTTTFDKGETGTGP